jgi:predicted metal-dependent HD superfamily phosphohydrolase
MYFNNPLTDKDLEILENYSHRAELNANQWNSIQQAYTEKGRYYHTLQHLLFMFQALERAEVSMSKTLLQAVFYHDIIYHPLKKDNEKKSADYALKTLKESISPAEAKQLEAWILATQNHRPRTENVQELFLLDADLAVLGAAPNIYQNYKETVRQEYRLVPKLLYRKGRRKVLLHFLNFETIYYTPFFKTNYEEQARANLKSELATL